MTDHHDPIQAQLVAARRNQILDAATEIFAENGFHRATIKQIAARAGIADGTIYIYFKNKNDLLFGILERLNQTDERAMQFAEGEKIDLRAFLVTYLRQRMNLMWKNERVFQAILPELISNDELRERYINTVMKPTGEIAGAFFQQQIEAGNLPPMDISLMLRVISSTLLGLLLLQIFGDEEVQNRWEEIPEIIADLFFPS